MNADSPRYTHSLESELRALRGQQNSAGSVTPLSAAETHAETRAESGATAARSNTHQVGVSNESLEGVDVSHTVVLSLIEVYITTGSHLK